jgi:hypothetical protein
MKLQKHCSKQGFCWRRWPFPSYMSSTPIPVLVCEILPSEHCGCPLEKCHGMSHSLGRCGKCVDLALMSLGQFVTYFHTMKFYIENSIGTWPPFCLHSTPKINTDGAFLALGLKAGGRGIWFGMPLCHFASFNNNNNNNNNNSLQAPVKI